jgi:hypothetical protein
VACPFFMPSKQLEEGLWLHPSRLPLGAGFRGHCTAPGHEGAEPASGELREFCNLGYARGCSRLPAERIWDAVRFSPVSVAEQRIQLRYVCEREHRPGEQGTLEYDVTRNLWLARHGDARIQKMAECYVEAYLRRRG